MKKVEITQLLFNNLIPVSRYYKLRHKLTSINTRLNSITSKFIFLQDFYAGKLSKGVMLDVIAAGIRCIFEGVENIILHSDFVCKCISEGM